MNDLKYNQRVWSIDRKNLTMGEYLVKWIGETQITLELLFSKDKQSIAVPHCEIYSTRNEAVDAYVIFCEGMQKSLADQIAAAKNLPDYVASPAVGSKIWMGRVDEVDLSISMLSGEITGEPDDESWRIRWTTSTYGSLLYGKNSEYIYRSREAMMAGLRDQIENRKINFAQRCTEALAKLEESA